MTTNSPRPESLPLRWAVIFIAAVVAGMVIGVLTYLQTGSAPAGFIAGLSAFGAVVPTLHVLLS